MEARPYKLFGARERSLVAAALEESLAAWSAAWLPAPAAARIDCAPACEAPARRAGRGAASWSLLSAAHADWIAAAAGEDDLCALAQALCGGADPRLRAPLTAASEIAAEAAARALGELCATLLSSPGGKSTRGEAAAPPADAWSAGSACYSAEVAIGAGRVTLVTSAEWTLRLLRARLGPAAAAPRPAERRAGVAGQRVALQVVAGWVEMDVRALRALAVGDVIALDARIDRPLSVATGSGMPVCSARLGSLGGRKAVSLSAFRS